jgi:hypothetical protein
LPLRFTEWLNAVTEKSSLIPSRFQNGFNPFFDPHDDLILWLEYMEANARISEPGAAGK